MCAVMPITPWGQVWLQCSKAPRIQSLVIWQYAERKGKHLKLFLLLQVFCLYRENARVGQVLSGALQGFFFFFFLHGLISFFLLLGRRVKHEKLVFTILDHPVQHKALFKNVRFTSPTVLWMPPFFWTKSPFPEYFQMAYLPASVIKIPLSF